MQVFLMQHTNNLALETEKFASQKDKIKKQGQFLCWSCFFTEKIRFPNFLFRNQIDIFH